GGADAGVHASAEEDDGRCFRRRWHWKVNYNSWFGILLGTETDSSSENRADMGRSRLRPYVRMIGPTWLGVRRPWWRGARRICGAANLSGQGVRRPASIRRVGEARAPSTSLRDRRRPAKTEPGARVRQDDASS